jgi:hypothetical protein
MDEADRYALEMLRRLDAQLTAFASTVRSSIGALEERTNEALTSQAMAYEEEEALEPAPVDNR